MLLCLLLPVLSFLVGITVQSWMLPVCALLAAGILYFLSGKQKISGRGALFWLLLVAVSVILAGFIYNIHWDGNTYHKTAVGLLMDGWNPLREDCLQGLSEKLCTSGMAYNARWVNHYANGSWILSAVFASFFGTIEAGKAVNLLLAVSVGGIFFQYLSCHLENKKWVFVVTMAAVLQPAVVSQIESFYIDGDLYLYLLLGVTALLMLKDERASVPKQYPYLFLAASIIYSINLKFTGMVYIGVFCIGYYICRLVWAAKEHRFRKVIVPLTAMFAGMAAAAIVVVGSSSYVSNFIENKNPLYPLFGEEKVDIMAYSEPNTFENKSNLEKSLISFFGKTENITNDDTREPRLKIPFTFSLSEIANGKYTDVRVGGFGPLYSGIFLISVGCVLLFFLRYRGEQPQLAAECATILLLALLMALFLPGSWWARYSAYLHFYVVFALFSLARRQEEKREKNTAWKSSVFALLVFLNTACFLLAPAAGVYLSYDIHQQKKQMQQEKEILVYVNPKQMTGIFWNLKEWGVTYQISEDRIEGNSTFGGHLIWRAVEKE